jgi:hypothetical protein
MAFVAEAAASQVSVNRLIHHQLCLNTHAPAFFLVQGLRTSQEMRELVQSPQFQQQVETFSAVSSSSLYFCLRFCCQGTFSCLSPFSSHFVLALEGSKRSYCGMWACEGHPSCLLLLRWSCSRSDVFVLSAFLVDCRYLGCQTTHTSKVAMMRAL